MERKKQERKKRRRKNDDGDIINDNDDIIADMMKIMNEAAEQDRELNKQRKPAIRVMLQLPYIKAQLKKADMVNSLLDSGILSSITSWLAPLPDHSLPHLEIREALLKQLLDFPPISTEGLKMSGLGKAVMYLFKHPKETKKNKEMCHKLITNWARPIFSQNADYKALSKEEREQRDYEQLPKKRKLSADSDRLVEKQEEKPLRPGDPGYVYRARVPAPSIKDYVIRPRWNVEDKPRNVSSKKQLNKFQQLQRAFNERKKGSKSQAAVSVSIEGRNMAL
ncbi:hypothetical protein HELRODRAFT_83644 [Helobdella robusta]|uniref:TFIIS N-terminal domain-containing protein n=1 Tax=Helobdella robusta TaxID=6412 RepID=T1G586_HELRO|nr:hypothetical protein HELRODRAFT_83644 [Helobdella robusta]ESN99982.1 hypothetical protein HELRODRAFT_83644 [Helobdella robusta]